LPAAAADGLSFFIILKEKRNKMPEGVHYLMILGNLGESKEIFIFRHFKGKERTWGAISVSRS
jgi:hypothetical protein